MTDGGNQKSEDIFSSINCPVRLIVWILVENVQVFLLYSVMFSKTVLPPFLCKHEQRNFSIVSVFTSLTSVYRT